MANSERVESIFVSLVEKLFIQTADNDYLAARVLWKYDLDRQYSWAAGQAVEKYTKAACYSNGFKACFSHDFVDRGIKRLSKEFKGLIPEFLEAPRGFESHIADSFPFKERLLDFAKRLANNGHPDSRYGQTEIDIDFYDLHKLDALCKILRRICTDVSKVVEGKTIRQQLEENPQAQSVEFFWQSLNAELKNHLEAGNYALNPDPPRNGLKSSKHISGFKTVMDVDVDTRVAAERLSNISRLTTEEILAQVSLRSVNQSS